MHDSEASVQDLCPAPAKKLILHAFVSNCAANCQNPTRARFSKFAANCLNPHERMLLATRSAGDSVRSYGGTAPVVEVSEVQAQQEYADRSNGRLLLLRPDPPVQ